MRVEHQCADSAEEAAVRRSNPAAESEMTSRLVALSIDSNNPLHLARFWADALQWETGDETSDAIGLVPTDDTRFRIVFRPVPERKAGKNPIHLDLTSTSLDDQTEI